MLVLWSGADKAQLSKVVSPVLSTVRVEHRVDASPGFPPHNSSDVILAFGSKALTVLLDAGLVPKNRTITSLRGSPILVNGAKVLLTYDPTIISRDYSKQPEIQWDVRLASRLVATGGIAPKLGEYRYVESLHELIEQVDTLYADTGKAVELACDLETVGLDEYNPRAWIVACSFTIEYGKSDVLYFEEGETLSPPSPLSTQDEWSYWEALWVQVNWLLTTHKVSLRGANFKYDSRWITHKWGIYNTNQKFDTMLVGSLLDENRSNSLKLHAKLFTAYGGYEDPLEKYDKGRMDLIPKEDILPYVGCDTDATYQVARVFKAELLKDKRLTNFYVKLSQPAVKAFEQMERNGVVVDLPYYQSLQGELEAEISRLNEALVQHLPNVLRIKHKDSIAKALCEGKNPLKPAILTEFMFTPRGLNLKPLMVTEKTKAPSTAIDHLMMFAEDPRATNFIELLKEHGSASKTLSTYVIGFLKHLRSDGMFHPSFFLAAGNYDESSKDSAGTNCITGESPVLCSTGWKPASEVVAGDRVFTHRGRWRGVASATVNGVWPVLEIHVGGRVLRCTGNHPLLTTSGWVFAKDIRPEFHHVICYNHIFPSVENEHGTMEGSTGVSGVLHIKPREAKDGYPAKIPLTGGTERGGSLKRVSVLLPEEQSGEGTSLGPQISRVCVPPASTTGASGGASLGRGSFELPLEESGVGDPTGESGRHGAPWDKYSRVGELPRQAVSTGGLSYTDRFGQSLWGGCGSEVPYWESDGISDKERKSLGFETCQVDEVWLLPPVQTYDLEVIDDHSFVVSGVVTHNTGRTSASSPAIQTLPKHSTWAKKLRRAFVAPPGTTILELDFSQGELRIAAVLAEEPTMLKAYMEGFDLHSITAAAMNGYSLEDFMLLPKPIMKELRSSGKAGNFGLLYGMQAAGFQAFAWNSYGVKMTLEESNSRRDGFFNKYSRLLPWHGEVKNFARRNGYVRSPLGRVRHLPLINSRDREMVAQAERNAVNSPVQATLSDMMQLAMSHIERVYGHDTIKVFAMTHDSIHIRVPIDDATIWAERLRELMENLPLKEDFGWDSPLKFLVDGSIAMPDEDGVLSLANMVDL